MSNTDRPTRPEPLSDLDGEYYEPGPAKRYMDALVAENRELREWWDELNKDHCSCIPPDTTANEYVTQKLDRIAELEGALRTARGAIASVDIKALGVAGTAQGRRWYIKDELLDNIDAALAGQQVGTELHSTSMQDGQMVNGEQTNE